LEDARELFSRAFDGVDRALVEADRADRMRGEARAFGFAKLVEEAEQVARLGGHVDGSPAETATATATAATAAVEARLRRRSKIALADQRREHRAVIAHAAPLCLDQHARLAWMQRKREHPPPDRGDRARAIAIDCAESPRAPPRRRATRASARRATPSRAARAPEAASSKIVCERSVRRISGMS